MAANAKVIITCAITGAITHPSMSPHLPVQARRRSQPRRSARPRRARRSSICTRAIPSPAGRTKVRGVRPLPPAHQAGDQCGHHLTTGGAPFMTVAGAVKPPRRSSGSGFLNMGSMNFGLFPMLGRFKESHEWGPQALENSRDLVFPQHVQRHRFVLASTDDSGTRFEFECYDSPISTTCRISSSAPRSKPPLFVQSVVRHLAASGPPGRRPSMKPTADRCLAINIAVCC